MRKIEKELWAFWAQDFVCSTLTSGLEDDPSIQAVAVGFKKRVVGKQSGIQRGTLWKQALRLVRSHPLGPSQNVHEGLSANELRFSG